MVNLGTPANPTRVEYAEPGEPWPPTSTPPTRAITVTTNRMLVRSAVFEVPVEWTDLQVNDYLNRFWDYYALYCIFDQDEYLTEHYWDAPDEPEEWSWREGT